MQMNLLRKVSLLEFRAVKMVDVVMPTADGRRADRHPAVLCRTEAGSGDSAGSARTDVARPAPAEDLKRSCRRGEIDCVVKTYEQNPSNCWGFARERGKSG